MSEVVGSTPSFIRNGRPSDSLSRSSFSLMICAAPCFKSARASSGCMFNHRIAHPAGALLVFIQQLAHLLDREWRILPVERLDSCPHPETGGSLRTCGCQLSYQLAEHRECRAQSDLRRNSENFP